MLRRDLRERRPVLVAAVIFQVAAMIISSLLRLWIGVVFFGFLLILFALELQPSERLAPSRAVSRAQGAVIWAAAATGMVALRVGSWTANNRHW